MHKLAIDKEKEKLENDKMKEEFEKLVIDHKDVKCIVRSQGEIMRNTRKEKDLLKEEKKKLSYVVGHLLKAGQGNKDKLANMKAILDE
ncbi:hypothetical protein D1007_35608 [Hordeum vulgare]|nr:hypothetical protein D1007_35608 [Hordeum vulgare]KAI4972423.1 hypothetical protein ZWY2020_003348 [Hordeum vulgare]